MGRAAKPVALATDAPTASANTTDPDSRTLKSPRGYAQGYNAQAVATAEQILIAVEPVFGDLKHNRRADRFQRRGRAACRSEWRLLAATHNLLKLYRATPRPA
jgi:hypothetical protein